VTGKRLPAFLVLYATILAAILVVFLLFQKRYGAGGIRTPKLFGALLHRAEPSAAAGAGLHPAAGAARGGVKTAPQSPGENLPSPS
jgi:hypothetical protein